jgi:hypothetical protein
VPRNQGGEGPLCRRGIRCFATPTDCVAGAKSNVAADIFRVTTRTVLVDHTAASSSTKRVDDTSDADVRSPACGPVPVMPISNAALRRQPVCGGGQRVEQDVACDAKPAYGAGEAAARKDRRGEVGNAQCAAMAVKAGREAADRDEA